MLWLDKARERNPSIYEDARPTFSSIIISTAGCPFARLGMMLENSNMGKYGNITSKS